MCYLSMAFYVSGTFLKIWHILIYVILMITLRIGTSIISIVQMVKLSLKDLLKVIQIGKSQSSSSDVTAGVLNHYSVLIP